MKLLKYALLGSICLAVVDKWAGLGFIWPETSQKAPDRPRSVSKHHPSVVIRSKLSPEEVSGRVVSYMDWYRDQWKVNP